MKSTRKIKEAIIRNYPEIGLDDSLGDAIKAMAKNNASALVVRQGGVLIGLVTITDVMHSLVHHHDLQDTKISSFMTKCELISAEATKNACAQLDEDQDVLSALKVMHQAGVNHLVVSRAEGDPVGVVSSLEIIRLLGR
ncbi:MAG: CBS domain-containing protein [Desulfofustis sp.]|jgi:predicted transcriptional regulator